MSDDEEPFDGFVSPNLDGDVMRFDDEDGSVWQLDRDTAVWRRVAGPGATSYLDRGRKRSWSADEGWTFPGSW